MSKDASGAAVSLASETGISIQQACELISILGSHSRASLLYAARELKRREERLQRTAAVFD